MADVRISYPKRVYGFRLTVGSGSRSFQLGFAPSGNFRDPTTISSDSYLSQSSGILGDNNVAHRHYSGHAECYVNSRIYSLATEPSGSTFISPCLYYQRGLSRDPKNDLQLGTHLAPENGSVQVTDPFQTGSTSFYGIYRSGFIAQMVQVGRRSIMWFSSDNLRFTYYQMVDSRYGVDSDWTMAQLAVLPAGFSPTIPWTPSGSAYTLVYANCSDSGPGSFTQGSFFYNLEEALVPYHPDTIRIEDDLLKKCVDDMKFIDINTSMFIKEALELKKLLPPVKDIKKMMKLSPKAWANTYLWYRYGVKLTISDVKEIIKGVKRAATITRQTKYARSRNRTSFSGVVAGSSTLDGYSACKLVLNRRPLGSQGSLWDMLRAWDLEPSLGHAWDFIPYSFVADWFLPIGNLLETFDYAESIAQLPIAYVTRSWKYTKDYRLPSSVTVVNSTIKVNYYNRRVSSSPRIPVFSWNPSTGGPSRIFDGAALVLQKSKH